MNEKLKMELITGIEDEIGELIFKNPKCDFEHAWNCAIQQAMNCTTGYAQKFES